MAIALTGVQLEWLNHNHSEFITILRELLSRKQIEMLGGGFYSPVFPLLFPRDRSGQIELLTSELTHTVGKRPRGMSTYGSIWDNSLVPTIATSGMEYVMLDSSLIPASKRLGIPLILTEQGKSVKALVTCSNLLPSLEKEQNPDSYLTSLQKTVSRMAKGTEYAACPKIINLNFSSIQLEHFISNGWMEKLLESLQNTKDISLSLALDAIHSSDVFIPTYVAPGISSEIGKWALEPYTAVENKSNYPVTIYDFFNTYPRNRSLYNRILYVSTIISQSHGDKLRKKAARTELWAAQTSEALVCNPDGIFATNAIRQKAYRHLTEAEKLIRSAAESKFKESVTRFDYNGDGVNEYLCQMKSHTSCISKKGASITELNIMHNSGNYADNLKRIGRFDKVDDGYERGLFIEHLFTAEEYSDYKKGLPTGNGVFSQIMFEEADFDSSRHEIKLRAQGDFSSMKIPVSLRKNYIATSNGYTVQYILKNESPIALKGKLVVESNFAQTDFTSADANSYTVEVISKEVRHELESKKKAANASAVSWMQVTDSSNDISFVFEPNEDAFVTCMPIVFHRPKIGKNEPQIAGTTFVTSFCWNVELSAGMEMEKTVNFTIITPKKRRSKK